MSLKPARLIALSVTFLNFVEEDNGDLSGEQLVSDGETNASASRQLLARTYKNFLHSIYNLPCLTFIDRPLAVHDRVS